MTGSTEGNKKNHQQTASSPIVSGLAHGRGHKCREVRLDLSSPFFPLLSSFSHSLSIMVPIPSPGVPGRASL